MSKEKYSPPKVKLNDWITDEIYGLVQVGGMTDSQISWPYRKKGGARSLILCGDLVIAVKNESAKDILEWFGVGCVTVAKWRKLLGVDRKNNQGTHDLYVKLKPLKLPDGITEIGRQNAKSPAAIAKMRASKLNKGSYLRTEKHKNDISERMRHYWRIKGLNNEHK